MQNHNFQGNKKEIKKGKIKSYEEEIVRELYQKRKRYRELITYNNKSFSSIPILLKLAYNYYEPVMGKDLPLTD